MPDPKRVYTDEEVQAILSRAIDRHRGAAPEGLSHDELLAVAHDAGISAESIEAAATDVVNERASEGDARTARLTIAGAFRAHLFTYLAVMAFLVPANVLTTPYPWATWPALGWGLALALHLRYALFPTDAEIARQVEGAAERRRRAEGRRRRRLAKAEVREGARELGHAVERGVATLLTSTAKRIHEEVDRASSPQPPKNEARVRVEPPAERRGEEVVDDDDESEASRRARRMRT